MKWKEQGGWKEGGKVVDIYSAQEVQGESALLVGYWGVWLACPRKHETELRSMWWRYRNEYY